MSSTHKAALATGREEGRLVRTYLEALESNRPKRGRRRTPQSIKKRLAAIGRDLPTADVLTRVRLIQERMDLERELDSRVEPVDLSGAERGFVKNAKRYSERKGISYRAWREAGVPAEVLQKAGIARTRRTS